MLELLRESGAHVAAWLPTALTIAALLGTGVVVFLWRQRTAATAGSRRYRVARAMAVWVLTTSVIGLAIAYGPMSPLFSSAGRLDAVVGNTVPEMSFRRVADGAPQRLSDFRGKVVLVNLWATWCPPCREELPTLDRLQKAYGSRGLVVITLSDERREQLAEFVESHAPGSVNGYVESFGWLTIRNFRPFTLVMDN